MNTGSLFGHQEPRAPPRPVPPPPPKFRAPVEKYGVKNPWGGADKHGNFFWQKMHKELEKLPALYQEVFNYIVIGAQPEHLDQLEKCLRMFNRATDYDRIDFDESMGRL